MDDEEDLSDLFAAAADEAHLREREAATGRSAPSIESEMDSYTRRRLMGMSPAEIEAEDTARRRKYDPYDTSEWRTSDGKRGWRTIDRNHYEAMREYYTQPKTTTAKVTVTLTKRTLELLPGPQPLAMITEKATC